MRVSELFYSIQGEGHLHGRPMYFIRTQGCAIKCPIRAVCDQPESLAFRGGEVYPARQLAELAHNAVGDAGWVCLTGGEPLEQADFADVVVACREGGLNVNVQTSGLRALEVAGDWLTVSPKAPVADLAVHAGDELKVVYTGQSNDELRAYYEGFAASHYYLQPCWGENGNNHAATLDRIYRLNAVGMRWDYSPQVHKLLGEH